MSAAFSDFVVHVNISRADLADRDLVACVRDALAYSGLRPQNLALELTENILMNTVDGAVETLADLRRLGVRISIDDFGTGQSSLSHLSTLPFDNLKIDQSFVQKLRENSKETEIVRAIVSLGDALGKSVIAEGVETSAQVDQLLELGCNLGQGFLLSQPIAPEQVESLLRGLEVRESRQPGHEVEPARTPALTGPGNRAP
jgi:EAL domain-containing protein (putative c-di-GMP-specific phosphodiesterase class I)